MRLVLTFAGLILAGCIAQADAVAHLRQDFEQPGQERGWSGWALSHEVSISRAAPGFTGQSCLRFTVPAPDWDTAILTFDPPLKVTADTVLRFRMRFDSGSLEGINVRDATEGSEYLLQFPTHPGEWLLVQQYLSDAVYKRFGKPDVARDGVAGDELSSLQIAYWGSELCIDDFEIFEAPQRLPSLPVLHLPAADKYTPRKHRVLREVCPFGVISTVGAGDVRNAELFGQTKIERFEEDLLDLQRHSMNAISNFCDDAEVESRLALMEKYRMYLVETALANADLRGAVPDDPRLQMVERVSNHPRLLAWYGRDEPQDYDAYFANRMAITRRDRNHPVASAFNQMQAVKVLGPYMDLVMLDNYSVLSEARDVNALAFHADLVRQARKLTAGGRVWLIPQSFSGRSGKTPVYRMPDPEEVRFDVYNALAAGATGFLFFIYNDACPFLDGEVRGEEFDDTLVDAWGNPHRTYGELARLGERLTPLLPALQDARDVAEPRVEAPAGLSVSRLANRHGTWVVLVNRSLSQPFHGLVRLPGTRPGEAYDAECVAPAGLSAEGELGLDLRPGEGRVLLLTSRVKWAGLRREVTRRIRAREADRLEVELGVLAAAGFDVGAAREAAGRSTADGWGALAELRRGHPAYTRTERELLWIRQGFGMIGDTIRPTVVATETRTDAAWTTLRDDLLAASRRYFALRRDWRTGRQVAPTDLAALRRDLGSLERRVAACVRPQQVPAGK